MTPINTINTTKILGAPNEWDASKHGVCTGLPILETEDPYMYSWWNLTFKERIKILFGKPVRLCVVGKSHPPVALQVSSSTD